MKKTWKARNTKTNEIKEFNSLRARERFINRKNETYGAYLWAQVFGY